MCTTTHTSTSPRASPPPPFHTHPCSLSQACPPHRCSLRRRGSRHSNLAHIREPHPHVLIQVYLVLVLVLVLLTSPTAYLFHSLLAHTRKGYMVIYQHAHHVPTFPFPRLSSFACMLFSRLRVPKGSTNTVKRKCKPLLRLRSFFFVLAFTFRTTSTPSKEFLQDKVTCTKLGGRRRSGGCSASPLIFSIRERERERECVCVFCVR